ncbi:tetratricopeptide repeat protein [Vibrio sp. PP-XX7]
MKARANLLKAKEIAPFYIRGQLAQAYYYDVIGESKKADKQYAEALSSHPHNPDALNNYGTFLCKQGQYQQAQDYFLQAYSQHRYPLIADAYENAGLCAIKAGQFPQAKLLFQKALDYDPNRIQSLVHLVDIEMTFFEYERAEKQVKQFIRQFGSTVQTTRLLKLLFQKAATVKPKQSDALSHLSTPTFSFSISGADDSESPALFAYNVDVCA